MKSQSNKLAMLTLPVVMKENDKVDAQIRLPQDRVGGFRLRMYWEADYNWQGSNRERFWCMECDGSCEEGDKIQIDNCSSSADQRFLFLSRTIRPTANVSLCLTTNGYGKENPIKLRSCDGSPRQKFHELKNYGKFELQPEDMMNTRRGARCLSQMHHPKAKEVVYPETCVKTRKTDTTYWVTF
eukprot:CCRYP_017945-RA/>CCRYP_017945-RA protein AED:0.03 eAED:0.03 QI:418/1/1/1/1/1/2/234/183